MALTPLNTWALYRKSDTTILKRRQSTPATIDGSIPSDLDPDLAWLNEFNDDDPVFDPATQKLSPWLERQENLSGNTGQQIYYHVAVPLTQEELDENAINAAQEAVLAQLQTIIDALKSGNNPNPNQARQLFLFILRELRRDGIDVTP